MCGIVGWAGRNPKGEFNSELLREMTRALAHRGPDGEGFFLEPGVALGHRRLSILDVERGAQPFFSPSGRYVLTYNGEVYNAPELRQWLQGRGFVFKTHCDTEVIAVLADAEGFRFVNRLEGIFAFGLWDREQRRLLLARDGLGVKPLLYRIDGDGIRFASEAKAFYPDSSLSWTTDPQGLHHYLSLNYIPAPFTIHREVKKLGHGEQLTWQCGTVNRKVYWRPPLRGNGERVPGDMGEAVRERVMNSVRGQLQSDVPLGVFLSAGMDSAVVLEGACAYSNPKPRAFCVGFREASFDERPGARETAELFGAEMTEYVLEPNLEEMLPVMAAQFDEPFADSSAVPVWELCRQAAREVKVALSGEGGDEVFCGYEPYRAHLYALVLRRLGLDALAGPAAAVLNCLPASDEKTTPLYKLKRFLPHLSGSLAARHFLWKVISTEEGKRRLYTDAWDEANRELDATLDHWKMAFRRFRNHAPISRAMLADMTVYLPYDILTKVDISSMAHSLEVRVPLLDRRIIEYVAPLPDRAKIDFRRKKKPLRAAFETDRTRPIFNRPKQGFSIPAARWLKRELRPLFLDAVSDSAFRDFGAIRRGEVQRLYRLHVERKEDLSRTLWGLFMLALWCRARPK